MLEQLRGRNLSHVGCTIGLTLGLFLGLIIALIIISLVRAGSATNLATAAWLGLTFILGCHRLLARRPYLAEPLGAKARKLRPQIAPSLPRASGIVATHSLSLTFTRTIPARMSAIPPHCQRESARAEISTRAAP